MHARILLSNDNNNRNANPFAAAAAAANVSLSILPTKIVDSRRQIIHQTHVHAAAHAMRIARAVCVDAFHEMCNMRPQMIQ